VTRTGARTRAAVPPGVLAQLNAGAIESVNLVEILSIDFQTLLPSIGVTLTSTRVKEFGMDVSITKRMRSAGELALTELGDAGARELAGHASDTARGIAAYALCNIPSMPISARLDILKPLAADHNQSTREWAWLAVRDQLIDELDGALSHLEPWASDTDENVRRYASEATRPRGVWCRHIRALRNDPSRGLPLLEPLRADPSRYVQNSVANWLNDASKDDPAWVESVCERWTREAEQDGDAARIKSTSYIVKRALRTLRK